MRDELQTLLARLRFDGMAAALDAAVALAIVQIPFIITLSLR